MKGEYDRSIPMITAPAAPGVTNGIISMDFQFRPPIVASATPWTHVESSTVSIQAKKAQRTYAFRYMSCK